MVKIKIARVAADGSDGEEVCTLSFTGVVSSSGGTVGFHNEILPAIAGSKAFSCGKLMWLETNAWAPGKSWSQKKHAVRAPIRIRSSTFSDGPVSGILRDLIFGGNCILSNAVGEKFHVTAKSTTRNVKEDEDSMPPKATLLAEGECGCDRVSFCPTPVVAAGSSVEEAVFVSKMEGYAPTAISEF